MALANPAHKALLAKVTTRRDNPEEKQQIAQSPVYITLPYPPSMNKYWRMVNGRMLLAASGKAYKRDVLGICLVARVKPISGLVAITARLYRPRKVGDLDNTLKAILDATKDVLFGDDDQIVRIVADRFDDKANPRAELEVKAV